MIEYLYIGDSNIGMFKLSKNKKIRVLKYKAASARGLSKEDNKNRIDIIKNISRIKPKCAIFNFGVVDIYFSLYYKLFNSADFKIDEVAFINEIADGYCKFLKELSKISKYTHFYIITPHYSPIRVKDVPGCLYNYNVINKWQIKKNIDKLQPYITRNYRNGLVDMFAHRIKQNMANMKDKFHIIDIMPRISKNGQINKKYMLPRKVSIYNIHLKWETTILEYVKIFARCGLQLDDLDLDGYDQYSKEKRRNNKLRYGINTLQ